MQEDSENVELNNLSTEETSWLNQERDKIIGYGVAIWDIRDGTKKDWIFRIYKNLSDIGYEHNTIYRFIREKINNLDIEITEGYLRALITKWSHYRIPRKAFYEYTEYVVFEEVREARLKYIESGQYQLDRIKKNEMDKDTERDNTLKLMGKILQ